MASSTSRTFSEVDQRRRRWTDVMTSTRAVGGIGSEDIALSIGLRLCLSELGRLSGKNGVRSTGRAVYDMASPLGFCSVGDAVNLSHLARWLRRLSASGSHASLGLAMNTSHSPF